MLDVLEMIGQRFDLDAFEVAQYLELSREVELHRAMGSDFEEAVSLAYGSVEII
jgi:hypothetical protein